MAKTYYNILNIPTSATQRDIKVAYRKLVQAHHPDVNKSGNDDFIKLINVAYETLSDPVKRAQYDNRFQSPYSASSFNTYTPPTSTTTRRKPPPNFYRKAAAKTNYYYSLKTKLMGWGAVAGTVVLIYIGIRALHYFASAYYYDEAVIAENNHNYNQAFELYELAIRDWGSKNVEASIQIVELNYLMGSYYAMVENSEIGLSFDPDSTETAHLYFLKATGYSHTERYTEAERAYLLSLASNFNRDSIYHQLGPLYLNKIRNYSKAEKVYTHLLIDKANNESDYFNRGTCFQYLGKHQKAIDDFLIVLKDDPYNGRILFQLGRSYLALGHKDVACEYLRFAQRQGININHDDFTKACD